MQNDLNIIPFDPSCHATPFRVLNEAWLTHYFQIEDYDREVLGNPQQKIIEPGGYIFMMTLNQEVMGTFAFLKEDEGVYEFNKMAIREDLRGMCYGTQLLQFALRFADQHHWKKLFLFSNRKLENSIYLYRKFGFEEVSLGKAPYSRGNIKMELLLH